MESALRIRTNVLPGHRIEIVAPELKEGTLVEAVLFFQNEEPRSGRSMLEILESLPPRPLLFKTPEEVDKYLEEERNSWDR